MAKNEIHVNHMENSSAAAGKKSTAIGGSQINRPAASEAADEMRALIQLIHAHQHLVPDSEQVERSVIRARKELKRGKPDLAVVRRALAWVAGAVSGVDVLADAVTKIQALIAHL